MLDAASGPCKGKGSDEQTLLRGLLDALKPGDVLLGDAYFPTYFLLGDLPRRGSPTGFLAKGYGKTSVESHHEAQASSVQCSRRMSAALPAALR